MDSQQRPPADILLDLVRFHMQDFFHRERKEVKSMSNLLVEHLMMTPGLPFEQKLPQVQQFNAAASEIAAQLGEIERETLRLFDQFAESLRTRS